MKKLIIVSLVMGLIGCSSKAVPPDRAESAPINQILLHNSYFDKSVELTVVRDEATLDSPCLATIYVNNEASAKLGSGQKVNLYLPVGEVTLGAGLEGSGLCKAAKPVQERDFHLSEGKGKVVRVFFDRSGYADLKPMSY